MKTNIVSKKMGAPYFFDQKESLAIKLPEACLISNYHTRAWFGGSKDGKQILFIEKLQHTRNEIPTILVEGDLNLFISSTASIVDALSKNSIGCDINGSYADRNIEGYLSLIKRSSGKSYLILMATEQGQFSKQMREKTIEFSRSFLKQGLLAA